MNKKASLYVCQSCGSSFKKWSGKCSGCGSWDSIVEEAANSNSYDFAKSKKRPGNVIEFTNLEGASKEIPRIETGFQELDRVLGGGLVQGAAILIGGDPGIGKSTLLLQTVSSLASSSQETIYISGEESVDQIRLRAKRLGLDKAPVQLASATSVADMLTSFDAPTPPKVVVIDSIQTMFLDSIESAPGTVSQVRACAHELITVAKRKGIILFLVGHVTKEGQIAGPKVLEHMVDTVLYFEGESSHQFRILRAVKNRFGAANEIGVFEMHDKGMQEVLNPSSLFLTSHERSVTGSSVFAGIEGSRPILVEVQALVAPTQMATPRRAVVGWDQNRLAMVIAVLATRYGVNVTHKEVYLNIAGGLRVYEPAADLSVAASLLSATLNKPLPEYTILFGEIGLSGEVRKVSQTETRLREAAKLGFTKAIVPKSKSLPSIPDLTIEQIQHIRELGQFIT